MCLFSSNHCLWEETLKNCVTVIILNLFFWVLFTFLKISKWKTFENLYVTSRLKCFWQMLWKLLVETWSFRTDIQVFKIWNYSVTEIVVSCYYNSFYRQFIATVYQRLWETVKNKIFSLMKKHSKEPIILITGEKSVGTSCCVNGS